MAINLHELLAGKEDECLSMIVSPRAGWSQHHGFRSPEPHFHTKKVCRSSGGTMVCLISEFAGGGTPDGLFNQTMAKVLFNTWRLQTCSSGLMIS